MEHMKLMIVTDDANYAKALGKSLLRGSRGFEISVLPCREFCDRARCGGQAYLQSNDLILWDSPGLEKIAGGNIIWLTDKESETVDTVDGERGFRVYKYSPSGAMTARLFHIYEALTGRRMGGPRKEDADIFAFASWQGGCGCTSLAMAAGQELVRFYRRRVLYLSLEGVESTACFMEVPEGVRPCGELIYRIMKRDPPGENAGMEDPRLPFLEQYLVRDPCGMESIAPSGEINPFHFEEPRIWDRIIPALLGCGRYDTILLDIGSCCLRSAAQAMSFADRICLVSAREEPEREQRYLSYLRQALPDINEDVLIRIRNRVPQSGEGEGGAAAAFAEQNAVKDPARGDKAGPAFSAELTVREKDGAVSDILAEGGFGKDIHKLTEVWYNQRKGGHEAAKGKTIAS